VYPLPLTRAVYTHPLPYLQQTGEFAYFTVVVVLSCLCGLFFCQFIALLSPSTQVRLNTPHTHPSTTLCPPIHTTW
jgi:hypothetical protein